MPTVSWTSSQSPPALRKRYVTCSRSTSARRLIEATRSPSCDHCQPPAQPGFRQPVRCKRFTSSERQDSTVLRPDLGARELLRFWCRLSAKLTSYCARDSGPQPKRGPEFYLRANPTCLVRLAEAGQGRNARPELTAVPPYCRRSAPPGD